MKNNPANELLKVPVSLARKRPELPVTKLVHISTYRTVKLIRGRCGKAKS